MQELYQPRSLGLLPSRELPLGERLSFAGVVPHFHFPLCDWLWANHVKNAWDFMSRCSRSESPSESLRRCLHYWTGLVTKTCLILASSEKVWLEWLQTFAKVKSWICIVQTGRFGCFPTFPTRLKIACDTLAEFSTCEIPELARVEPYQTYTGPVEDWCVITAWQAITTACITTAWKDRDQWSTRERRRRKDVKSPLSP